MTARRRTLSVTGVATAALLLTLLLPVWLPLVAVIDLLRGLVALSLARLLCVGLGWTWLETMSVAVTFALRVARRSRDPDVHYALQRWWAIRPIRLLARTTGIQVQAEGVDALSPGPVVVLCRHAGPADSLVSAWVVTTAAGLRPRYVLKRELLADPCLDIAREPPPQPLPRPRGARCRVPAHRARTAGGRYRRGPGRRHLSRGGLPPTATTRRALAWIAERGPHRADAAAGLSHLLPPRPCGTLAVLAGAPAADVAVAWHTGFDGLDTFGWDPRALARPSNT